MYRLLMTAVLAAGLLLSATVTPAADNTEDANLSPQKALERLVAVARLKPNPGLDRPEAEARAANVPGTSAIFSPARR